MPPHWRGLASRCTAVTARDNVIAKGARGQGGGGDGGRTLNFHTRHPPPPPCPASPVSCEGGPGLAHRNGGAEEAGNVCMGRSGLTLRAKVSCSPADQGDHFRVRMLGYPAPAPPPPPPDRRLDLPSNPPPPPPKGPLAHFHCQGGGVAYQPEAPLPPAVITRRTNVVTTTAPLRHRSSLQPARISRRASAVAIERIPEFVSVEV